MKMNQNSDIINTNNLRRFNPNNLREEVPDDLLTHNKTVGDDHVFHENSVNLYIIIILMVS